MELIHRILLQYPADCSPVRIEPLGSAGGMSGAQFWRVTALRGTLALRRWPTELPAPERLRFIHSVINHAAQNGIKILPIPVKTRAGQSFTQQAGHLWELAPWMPGTANYAGAPTVEKLRAAMISLAQFHLAVHDFPDPSSRESTQESPAILDRLARLQELAHGGQRQLSQAIVDTTWTEFAATARQFLAALPNALPHAIALHEPLARLSFSLQPCIRDIWHDHVLFTGNQVTGMIDFGAMEIDTPACDVARLLGGLAGNDETNRQIGLAAYSSVRPLAAHELRAVAAFDTSIILLAGCNWIRWICIEGRHFENLDQILHRLRRIVDRTQMMISAPRSA